MASFRIIYPHSYSQFMASGRSDEDLMQILEVVHLAYLPDREGGWTTQKEWRDVLSGGEKQRVCIAQSASYPFGLALISFASRWVWPVCFIIAPNSLCSMVRQHFHSPASIESSFPTECTSAVSTDVEGLMYQHGKDLGITLITISHRYEWFHTRSILSLLTPAVLVHH
jgi:ATP-binding cassette, subfamily D (ALD), peroxisomal long-chain fatty acid import protein